MSQPAINRKLFWSDVTVAGGILAVCGLGWYSLLPVPLAAKAFPGTLLAIFAVLGAVIGLRAVFFPRAAKLDDEENANWSFFRHMPRFVIIMVLMGAYISVLDILGFFTASAIFLVAGTMALGYRQYAKIAIAYVCFLVFVYAIFVGLFDRPLPKEFWMQQAANPLQVAVTTQNPRS